MKCAYTHCESEAHDLFPVALLYAPKSYVHWRTPAELEMDIPHCEAHRAGTTPEMLFSEQSKKELEQMFRQAGKPLPDWSRTKIKWLRQEQMQQRKADRVFHMRPNP